MDLAVRVDEFGRLVCTAQVDGREAVVTASDVPAATTDLLAALDEARATGFGECFWPTEAGDYRWIFRRAADRVTVVALRSSGTITGWQHVIYTETAFEPFASHLSTELARVSVAT